MTSCAKDRRNCASWKLRFQRVWARLKEFSARCSAAAIERYSANPFARGRASALRLQSTAQPEAARSRNLPVRQAAMGDGRND